MSTRSAAQHITSPVHLPPERWNRPGRSDVWVGDDETSLVDADAEPRAAFAVVLGASALGGSLIWALAGYVIYQLAG